MIILFNTKKISSCFIAQYNLKSVELEILKAYIKTILANSFIISFTSLVGASVFFNHKSNRYLCLCIDYYSLWNLKIKN